MLQTLLQAVLHVKHQWLVCKQVALSMCAVHSAERVSVWVSLR
jgi:hypothetical protein